MHWMIVEVKYRGGTEERGYLYAIMNSWEVATESLKALRKMDEGRHWLLVDIPQHDMWTAI